MVRLLKPFSIGLLGLALHTSASAEEPSRHRFELGADLSYVSVSGHQSWTEGGAGKLRYDDDGLVFSRGFLDVGLQLTDTVELNLDIELYNDDLGPLADFTEAFVEWRPLVDSANRYRFKVGAFYPRVSMENTAPGWSSPYTISPSALNTWVGEELRSYGMEASISRRPASLGGAHSFSLHGSIFYKNDPAGALLAWKGWSIHDRQTRLSDLLPLPPIPQIQPGMWFQRQDPFLALFMEIDNDPGYYVSAEYRYSNKAMFRVTHYDNRADPRAFENGQYGWGTDFNMLGMQFTLPGDIGLIYQWMDGLTVMGPFIRGAHVVDADYYSDFLLLTRAFGPHRLSARYDRFGVYENDSVPLDDNSEYGHGITVSYAFEMNKNVSLAAEWISIYTYRDAWEYYGLEDEGTETQLQLAVRLRFGNSR